MTTRTVCAALAVAVCVAVLPSSAATWLDGASGKFSDADCWVGRVVPTTGDMDLYNTSGNVLYVTNDVTGTGTWNGAFKVQSGSWDISGSFAPTITHLLLCHAETGPASAVNYCDWNIKNFFAIAHNDNGGATATFTNRAGRIYIGGGQSWHLAIARYAGSPKGTLVFEGGELTTATNSVGSTIGHGDKSDPGAVGTLLMKGGTIRLNHTAATYIGGYGTGYLTIEGGTFSVNPNGNGISFGVAGSSTGHVLLKAGTLVAALLDKGNGTGASTFTIDGGKWIVDGTSSKGYAIANSAKLTFAVGANGGTIEVANGASAVIPADVNEYSGSTGGGLTLAGFGSISFTGAIKYTGETTIKLGAAVSVTNSCMLTGGVAVAIPETPPDDGMYTVLTTTGEDTLETLFDSVTFPASDPKARFRLSADKKSIICLYGDVEQTWIGGASGDLGDAANWSTGIVPTDGNAVISSGAAATLTSSAAFTPDSITFPSGTAQITIAGDAGISGLLAVTNEASGVHHVFECPVSFAANAEADISCGSGTYVKFTGGMTAYTLKLTGAEAYISGNITLTKDIANWAANVEIDLLHLCDGATLTIPRSVTVDGTANFKLDSGTTLNIEGDISASAYFTSVNNGVVNVSGRAISTGSNVWQAGSGSGIMKASGLVSGNSSSRFVLNTTGNWIVGQDGMTAAKDFYTQTDNSSYIYPYSDFTMSGSINNAGSSSPKMYISTTDYYDSTVKRVVTINAGGGGRYALTVNGIGTALFIRTTTFASSLTANNSVTVAVNDGCRPGNGAVTMNGTSTLKVAQSGTVTLGGKLTLTANAALAFNFTDRATAPTLALKAASTIPATVNVKVSADAGIRPSSSRTHTLTSGYDFTGKTVNLVDPPDWVQSVGIDGSGNIVLTVKPVGLIIIFQ